MSEDQSLGREVGMGSARGQGRLAEWWRRYSRTVLGVSAVPFRGERRLRKVEGDGKERRGWREEGRGKVEGERGAKR